MKILEETPLELSEAEQFFDDTVRAQRRKGRSSYGHGLLWQEGDADGPLDFRHMALEEAVDLAQYLTTEVLRQRYQIKHLERLMALPEDRASVEDVDFVDYQRAAMRTASGDPPEKALSIRALGLAGEAGEVVELIKKHLGHGHELDRDKLCKELGDVLWYVATLADAAGIRLEEVALKNVQKLRERYPQGFSHDASRNRTE